MGLFIEKFSMKSLSIAIAYEEMINFTGTGNTAMFKRFVLEQR
jgi:hypothetical protein